MWAVGPSLLRPCSMADSHAQTDLPPVVSIRSACGPVSRTTWIAYQEVEMPWSRCGDMARETTREQAAVSQRQAPRFSRRGPVPRAGRRDVTWRCSRPKRAMARARSATISQGPPVNADRLLVKALGGGLQGAAEAASNVSRNDAPDARCGRTGFTGRLARSESPPEAAPPSVGL